MSGFYNKIGGLTCRPVTAAILVILVTVMISGCGYRFAGSAGNRLSSSDSVWVAFVSNETAYSTAQTVLRRALLDELHAMRGITPTATKEQADLQISGFLRSYGTIRAIAYTSIDRVREYRVVVNVDLEVRRKGEEKPFWKGNLMANEDFPGSDDLALQRNAEDAALASASRKVAEKLVTALENSY